jgi:hypothetical protein
MLTAKVGGPTALRILRCMARMSQTDVMKDQTILAIKGLAIIGVVFHHLVNRREDHQSAQWVLILVALFHWCVLAFIGVSGYLHAWSDSRRVKSVGEFVQQRFIRLMVPWVCLIVGFALIWQTLQLLHVPNIGVKIPPSFFSKIAVSLWPVTATVGEQLYYLPILFGASVIFTIVHRVLGTLGVLALVVATFVAGLAYFPNEFTAFRLGMLIWAICFYAAGYLLFQYREKVGHIRMTLIVATAFLFFFNGHYGVLGSVPLWLIVEGSRLRLAGIPGLPSLGEASGTIYIYHTPFIIQTLVIAATYLHGPVAQFIGVLCAEAIAIAICYTFYHLAKDTRAQVLLM